MKTLPLILSAALLLAATLPATAQQMNYQGRLTDASGNALTDGRYTVEFSLWDAATGGNQIWGPYVLDGAAGNGHAPQIELVNGRFNTVLGAVDTTNRPLVNAFAATRYLQIRVGSNAPITPRQQILAAPDAIHAQIADTVPAGAIGTAQLANLAITGDKIADNTIPISKLTGAGANLWDGDGTDVWRSAGSVGIGGTPTAGSLLSLSSPVVNGASIALTSGAITSRITQKSFQDTDRSLQFWSGATGSATGRAQAFRFLDSDANNILTMMTDGSIGIGGGPDGSNPMQARVVIGQAIGPFPLNGPSSYLRNPLPAITSPAGNFNMSLYASDEIAALGFRAWSDARIKRIEGRSDSSRDLATLTGIEVTDYTYIDTMSKGTGKSKKVIAQQVEAVYPQAVSRSTDVVPDIYLKATVKDHWVALATDLKVGERVRLIGARDEAIHEVLEVRDGAFRTAFQPATDEVFVYGREVKDFRSVDYEAIAMLNVSATQELARQLTAKDARIAALEKSLADLQAKEQARDTKLAAIEALLTRNGSQTVTVSLNQ